MGNQETPMTLLLQCPRTTQINNGKPSCMFTAFSFVIIQAWKCFKLITQYCNCVRQRKPFPTLCSVECIVDTRLYFVLWGCFSQAAEEAGFSILRVVNESTAALLAYDIGQDDPSASWWVAYTLVSEMNSYEVLGGAPVVSIYVL